MKPNKNFLSGKMYKQYKETVKGNENTSHEQAKLKMWRNMLLASASRRDRASSHFKYGCLHFIVANGKVVWMQNECKPERGWRRNNKKYLELNRELGIESDETMLKLHMRELKGWAKYNKNRLKWKLKSLFYKMSQ